MSKVDVLILSAGRGTRVKKDFPNTPKALINIDGDVALDRVLFPFKNSNMGFESFNIKVNIRKDEEELFKLLGYDLCVEDIPLGNAGAIKVFGENLSDPFLVSHNDIDLRDMDISDLLMNHLQNDSFCTMTVSNIGQEKERGIIVRKHNKVLGFTRERFINCGLYCISHGAFSVIEDGFQDIDEHMLPRLSSIHQLSCYIHKGHYEDWGR